MAAVLGAVTDVLKIYNGKETETEYFAALVRITFYNIWNQYIKCFYYGIVISAKMIVAINIALAGFEGVVVILVRSKNNKNYKSHCVFLLFYGGWVSLWQFISMYEHQ